MKIDLKELHRMTEEAIREGEKELQEKLARERAEEELQEQVDLLKAKSILQQIPQRTHTEAKAGRRYATLMSIGHGDYTRPRDSTTGWNVCKPEWLKGPSKIVYDECVKLELRPTIEHWHDGVGERSGFNILLHW